jgi:hypothetical protein
MFSFLVIKNRLFITPNGALPLFIGGGDHEVVRGCRKSEELEVRS